MSNAETTRALQGGQCTNVRQHIEPGSNYYCKHTRGVCICRKNTKKLYLVLKAHRRSFPVRQNRL